MKIIKYNKNFYKNLDRELLKRYKQNNILIHNDVKKIIRDVKKNGDKSILKYTEKFDKIKIDSNKLLLDQSIFKSNKIDKNILNSFRKSIKNISKFHKKQFPKNILQKSKNILLKSVWKPIDSVGLYIPGGNAFYPSSLIMNAVPAIIAGVKRIVCVTPPSKKHNPYLLALLKELNLNEVYNIGGAQAITALTFGTKTIKPVNKIFGPGNAYVAEAKKQLFGNVGIDMIAGPSEIIVVANNQNKPDWVASDLMAQAEHDINAQAILITDDIKFAQEVILQIKKLNTGSVKKNIINKSLKQNGLIILLKDIFTSSEIINYIAPEHLHIHIKSYNKLLPYIRNTGGIFLGEYSTEAYGDYIIGTNHILPTSGSAKFSSGLGVLDFMKRNSIVEMNSIAANQLASDVENMANVEGLDAHKLSVKIRQNN